MKLTKIIVPVVISAAMLAGCSAQPTTQPTTPVEDNKKDETPADTLNQQTDDGKEDVVEVKDDYLTDLSQIKVIGNYADSIYRNDDQNGGAFIISYGCAEVIDEGYDGLKKALETVNADIQSKAEALSEENKDLELIEGAEYTADFEVSIIRADEKLTSINVLESTYLGGVHPNSINFTYNIDSQTGAFLTASDIVSDETAFAEAVDAAIKTEYADEVESFFAEVPELMSQGAYNMTISQDSITVSFDQYVLAPYAAGIISVSLKPSDYDFVKKSYFIEKANMAKLISLNQDYEIDANEDGQVDTVRLEVEFADFDNVYNDTYKITCNGQEYVSTDTYSWYQEAYLASVNGCPCVILHNKSDNDYGIVDVIAYKDNDFVEYYFGNAHILNKAGFNTDAFMMSQTVDALGTYMGYKTFSINDKFEIVSDDAEFIIPEFYTQYAILTTTADLDGTVVESKNGLNAGDAYTIAAGSKIYIYTTDNASYANVKTEDGTIVKLEVNHEEWPYMVAGKDENECFEYLPYAG